MCVSDIHMILHCSDQCDLRARHVMAHTVSLKEKYSIKNSAQIVQKKFSEIRRKFSLINK